MPPRRRGRPRINPLPQDKDRNIEENVDEQVEAQASVVGSSSIAAPPVTHPMADLNLAEVVAPLARVIPALTTPTEKGIVDYCKDLKNMSCNVFTRCLEPDLAWSWLLKIETTAITLQIPEPLRLQCAMQFLEDHAHTWWKTTLQRYAGRPALSWANFRREFEEKNYSWTLKEKKWTEFMNLKQGGMSIAEYEQKFTELSEFAPSVVANDEDRCKKF